MATPKARTSVVRTDLTVALTAAVDRAKQAEADAHAARLEAERALKLARGTGDLHAQAAAAVARSKRGPYYVGDNADTEHSLDAVLRCIADRPRTLWEIVDHTGIRRNRVSGFLVRLQQRRVKIKNVSKDAQRALWFAPNAAR